MAQQADKPEGDVSKWELPGGCTVDGIIYPDPATVEMIDKIRDGDVPEYEMLLATYPRTGTARLIEICWLLMHGCDTEKARDTNIINRHMFLELMNSSLFHYDAIEPPVVAKTHIDFQSAKKLVESDKKVVVGLRNPKDTLVSYYHFNRMNKIHGLFPGNWRQFLEYYKDGRFPYGDYFDNVMSWWAERERENILVVHYEDLNENPLEGIRTISTFLGQNHSEEELQKVADWTSFSNIKKQPLSNYTTGGAERVLISEISTYMRKGTAGDWKNYFTDEDNKYMDDLCEAQARPHGLTFKFE